MKLLTKFLGSGEGWLGDVALQKSQFASVALTKVLNRATVTLTNILNKTVAQTQEIKPNLTSYQF